MEAVDVLTPALSIRGLSKAFGSVSALEHVDLDAHAGEIHAIVGDNGAGKSTVVKIVTGIHDADEGEIRVRGDVVGRHFGADHAQDLGLAVVHQDLALVESLDIATNLWLGNLPTRFRYIVDRSLMKREAERVLKELQVRVDDVTTPVGLLSGGQRQVIAIVRAVRLGRPVLLLDEPTAALGVRETAHVGEILDQVRSSGTALVLISHDLEFVFAHADRITVLRLGRSVGTREVAAVRREEIVGMITGAIADSPAGHEGTRA